MKETTIAAQLRDRCLRPGCKREAECRGLCRSDYQTAYQLVADGVTTWEQLQRNGKVLGPRRLAKVWLLAS